MSRIGELIMRGTHASRPSAGIDGRLYYETDTNTLYRDNGSSWDSVEGSGGFTSPLTTVGDIIFENTGPTPDRLPIGSAGQILMVSGGKPIWNTLVSSGNSSTISSGAYGSEPGSPSSGDLYLPTNADLIEYYDGSAWKKWGPIFPLTDPTLQSWSWINQGSATVDTTKGGIFIRSDTTNNSLRIRKKSAPSTPYKIDVLLQPSWSLATSLTPSCGIGFRESGSGKIHACWIFQTSGQPQIYSYKLNDPSNLSGSYASLNLLVPFPPFFRIEDDGSNRKIWTSYDGQEWSLFHSVGRTDFLTADEVCFFASGDGTNTFGMRVLSWYEH